MGRAKGTNTPCGVRGGRDRRGFGGAATRRVAAIGARTSNGLSAPLPGLPRQVIAFVFAAEPSFAPPLLVVAPLVGSCRMLWTVQRTALNVGHPAQLICTTSGASGDPYAHP